MTSNPLFLFSFVEKSPKKETLSNFDTDVCGGNNWFNYLHRKLNHFFLVFLCDSVLKKNLKLTSSD